jgi:hypothetical protein
MRGSLNRKHHWGVILGGGDGMRMRSLTRFLTGDERPKQFCRLGGQETLLEQTRQRVARALSPDRTLLLLTKTHAPYYAAELAAVRPRLMVVHPATAVLFRRSCGASCTLPSSISKLLPGSFPRITTWLMRRRSRTK